VELVVERGCGLDVHKANVVACVMVPGHQRVRTFSSTTGGLLSLLDWLRREQVTALAMESTGSYWKPVWNLLEGQGIELTLANAHHVKAVPGRKTDVKDAEWLADLLKHGLIRASRVFERPMRELQECVRYRTRVVEARADEVRRVQKVLEGGNIKLSQVASDVMGVSGRAMLSALAEGEEDPERLAALAQGRLKSKNQELRQALLGRMGPHQRFMLRELLDHIEFLDQKIERLNAEIDDRMRPFEAAVQMLDEIPGIGRTVAQQIISETGTDMSHWANHRAFASWAGLSPGNNQSAGKRRSASIGHGRQSLRGPLVEAAWALTRVRNTRFAAMFHRIKQKRGSKRAIIAVAHALLVTIFHMLKEGAHYQDLGPHYLAQHDPQSILDHHVRALQRQGYSVTLTPAA
jgi:transposase